MEGEETEERPEFEADVIQPEEADPAKDREQVERSRPGRNTVPR